LEKQQSNEKLKGSEDDNELKNLIRMKIMKEKKNKKKK
jgi:hypothetical protein